MINTHPDNNGSITVAEGSDVTLKCTATGEGTLNYQWRRGLKSLPSNFKSNGGQKYTIHNIAVDDNGQYYCEVDNGGEKVTSRRVKVTVKSLLLHIFE